MKKIGFLRQANPFGFGFAIHSANTLKQMFSAAGERRSAPQLDAG
ncbi:hypothetical protein [Bradyrhizobium sp. NAS80.1]|nr:hypothetical protein [Bradyrhizobium sp. NAS80.1]